MKVKPVFSLGIIAFILVCAVVAPPVDPKRAKEDNKKEPSNSEANEIGLEYERYLQQVVQALEKDEDFAKKLENISVDDIKSGKIAKELQFVKHNIRTQLDELKRIELERIRALARQELELMELGVLGRIALPPDHRQWRSLPRGFGDGLDRSQINRPKHLDLKNEHTFEIEDLRKLIKTASKDLDDINEKRKEEFKQYELEKQYEYKDKLQHMTAEERIAEEAKHQESLKRHKDHPKIHHPGSKQQLEQVWEEHDQLPRDEFNPSTFFAMHDMNGDGNLDEEEVEALLTLEVKKMYDPNNTDDDPNEMMEEYHRMREHIYNETDSNKDGLISKQEFIDMTRRAEFNQDEGWKGLDEENVYSEDDYAAYERMHQEQMRLAEQGQYHPGVPQGNPQYQYYPQQGVPNEQYRGQAGGPPPPHYPPQQGGVPHPNQYPPHGIPPPHIQQHNNQFQQGVPPQQNQYQQGIPPQQGGQYHQGVPPQQGGQYQQGQYHQGVPPQQGQYQQGGQYHQGVPPQQQGIPPQQQGVPPQQQQGVPPQQGIPNQAQPQGVPQSPQQNSQQQNVPPQQGLPQNNQAGNSRPSQ